MGTAAAKTTRTKNQLSISDDPHLRFPFPQRYGYAFQTNTRKAGDPIIFFFNLTESAYLRKFSVEIVSFGQCPDIKKCRNNLYFPIFNYNLLDGEGTAK